MKIGILTCIWKRHDVFEIYAAGIRRLREYFDIVSLAVGSEGEISRLLCKKHDFMYLEKPNEPLGMKFADGLKCFKETDVDYVIIMGSDDLISKSLIEAYLPHMEKGVPFIGILDIYFYDLFKKSLHYWPGYGIKMADKSRTGEPVGLGRCLSRKLLNEIDWNIWDNNIMTGLDGSMWQRLMNRKIKTVMMKLTDINALAVDLKGDLNICNRILYKCDKANDYLMDQLSDKENILIKRYGTKK